ncbi:MAG: serine--tRNA ligase [Rickettsiales bacterium]|jgi:seryl-tRNA synthetase|nr:serine--tRNA ligase [Rickettsiales bacterium]
MLNLKWIIENPELFNQAAKRRKIDLRAEKIIGLNNLRKGYITKLQELQSERNSLSKEVGVLKTQGKDVQHITEKVGKINEDILDLEALIGDEKNSELYQILTTVPNILQGDVPDGVDSENVVVRTFSEPTKFDFIPKPHYELGEMLRQMDFSQAGHICGARSTALFDGLAKLERALSNFFLDFLEKNGYRETSIPFFVKEEAMFGTGNLPKFAEDSYHTTENLWFIPTSEVSMTNWVANRVISEKELPLRLTAYTPCWRSEAGSAGKDTRGMFRQHQFKKVEMVSITTPENSDEEHKRMIDIESDILRTLNIPFRMVVQCSGDTGFGSTKTYDHEVWLPGQNTYREISSCSNCKDFQARRMNARYKKTSDGKLDFVHTLNGSALAIGRTIIAIMENYQKKDGSITIPRALIPYMNGVEIIEKQNLFI